MRANHHCSLVLGAEFYLLILVILTFFYSFSIVYQPKPSYVRQLETFEESIESIISCSALKNNNAKQESFTSNSNTKIIDKDKTVVGYKLGNENGTVPVMPRCPIDRDRLKYFNDYELNTWLNYQHIKWGGRFKPIGCEPLQKVAIVIPYRDRREQLDKFSLYIHQFLPDQLVEYTLYVIEQSDNLPFNRAKLFNIGVKEILKLDPSVCCFIFHDVDLLPLDQRNLYMCSTWPRHLSPLISTLRFNLLYPTLFGGAISTTRSQFETIGGFSNDFYGWGGEDDDIFRRVRAAGYGIERVPAQFGVYIMLKHSKMQPNTTRFQLLKDSRQKVIDDANGATYKVDRIVEEQLFIMISVEV